MDYKVKQLLTKEFIEQDIKKVYRSKLVFSIISFCEIVILLIFVFALLRASIPKKDFIEIFILAFIAFVIALRNLISRIREYTYGKYTLVIDRLIGMGNKILDVRIPSANQIRYGIRHHHIPRIFNNAFCFTFATQKDVFKLDFEKTYYSWSEHYCMLGRSVENSSSIGDDFYLVLVGKKIVSIYNKKMFELVDELEATINTRKRED